MRRCSSLKCLRCLALLAALAGCAFEDGQPWGEARIAIDAVFEVPAERLDGAAIRTNNDYLVQVESAELSTDAVFVRFAAAGGTASFDPADPPEGYSLCHNGHCHHDDGRLVDYADIEIEISGGGASVSTLVRQPIALTPNAAPVPLALDACGAEPCELPRGDLSSVEVQIRSARVAVEVRDRRTGDAARLDGPRAVTIDIDEAFVVQAPLAGTVGRGEPVSRRIEGRLRLDASAFDNLDWQSDPSGATLRGALLDAIELRIP